MLHHLGGHRTWFLSRIKMFLSVAYLVRGMLIAVLGLAQDVLQWNQRFPSHPAALEVDGHCTWRKIYPPPWRSQGTSENARTQSAPSLFKPVSKSLQHPNVGLASLASAESQQERCKSFGVRLGVKLQRLCNMYVVYGQSCPYSGDANGARHNCYLRTSSPLSILSSLEIKLYNSHCWSFSHTSWRC